MTKKEGHVNHGAELDIQHQNGLDLPKKLTCETDRVTDPIPLTFWRRLKVDRQFRYKFTHTAWICWSFLGLGWVCGQVGPSFPDLRLIVQEDLETASWLFTLFAVGYMVGSLAGGVMYDRYNTSLVLALSTVVLAVSTAVLPWCKSFYLMSSVRFISGFGAGSLDTVGNADVISLWKGEGGSYMQALAFCYSFGGIISPLATEPFLAETSCITETEETGNSSRTTQYPTGSTVTRSDRSNSTRNYTHMISFTPTTFCAQTPQSTSVQYAYLISFAIVLSSALPFLQTYVSTRKRLKDATDKLRSTRGSEVPSRLRAVYLVLLFMLFALYCSVENSSAGFLATFCREQFNWDSDQGSYATSVLWASQTAGSFLGIFLVARVKPVQLLAVFLIILIVAFVGLLVVTMMLAADFVWVFVSVAGLATSVEFQCVFTWTEVSIMPVTGKMSSMFLVAASTGLILNPLLLGFVIQEFSPIWFVYTLLVESCLCFAVFLILYFFATICAHGSHGNRTIEIVTVTHL